LLAEVTTVFSFIKRTHIDEVQMKKTLILRAAGGFLPRWRSMFMVITSCKKTKKGE